MCCSASCTVVGARCVYAEGVEEMIGTSGAAAVVGMVCDRP